MHIARKSRRCLRSIALQIDQEAAEKWNCSSLFVDVKNTFNSTKRKTKLGSALFIYPVIWIFIWNCYVVPTRLFMTEFKELNFQRVKTREANTKEAHAPGVTPLLNFLHKSNLVNNEECPYETFVGRFKGKLSCFMKSFPKTGDHLTNYRMLLVLFIASNNR